MLSKIFNTLQKLNNKSVLPKYLFFCNISKFNTFSLKKIIIWLFCYNKKNDMICKSCLSCTNFKYNNHPDYYELVEKINTNYLIKDIENIIITSSMTAHLKIIFLILNSENISLIQKIIKVIEKDEKILLIFYFIKKINYYLNVFQKINFNNNLCIPTLKALHSFFKNRSNTSLFDKINKNNYINKINVINSFVIFLNSAITQKHKKSHIIFNTNYTTVQKFKNIIKFAIIYKHELMHNYNLNLTFFINFFTTYMKNQ